VAVLANPDGKGISVMSVLIWIIAGGFVWRILVKYWRNR
jgi:hypothetical protein